MPSTILAPVLSGYIVEYSTWPVCYWYNLSLGILVTIVLFIFLEETQSGRPVKEHLKLDKENWLQRRLILLPGAKSSCHEFSALIVVS
jgi:MFS family permease